MKHLTISLREALYHELLVVAADSVELDEPDAQPTPEEYA